MIGLRNTGIAGILLIGLGAIAFITNPQEPGYKKYASLTLKTQLQEKVCTQIAEDVGSWLEDRCYPLVLTISPYLSEIVAQQTKRHDFLLFSIYAADLPLPSPLPDYRIETLGVLGNFYTYKAKQL